MMVAVICQGDSEGNEGGGESEKEKVNDMLVEVQLELVPPSQPAPVLPDSSSRQTASEEEAEPEPIEIADSDLMYTYEDKKLPLHPRETTPQKKTVEDIPEGKTLVPGTIDWLEAQLATLHQEQEVLNLNLSFKVCCLVFGSWDVNVTCFFYVRVGFSLTLAVPFLNAPQEGETRGQHAEGDYRDPGVFGGSIWG